MTVSGILGCTALLVVGMAIKNSVTDLMPKQYEVADGVLKISLQKYSAVILMYDRSEN